MEYYKTKFKNVKENARKRRQYIAKQKITGGGRLTRQEQRIIQSNAYSDLVIRLGVSASGNDSRNDSDSLDSLTQPPTNLLQSVLDTNDDSTLDGFPSNFICKNKSFLITKMTFFIIKIVISNLKNSSR